MRNSFSLIHTALHEKADLLGHLLADLASLHFSTFLYLMTVIACVTTLL